MSLDQINTKCNCREGRSGKGEERGVCGQAFSQSQLKLQLRLQVQLQLQLQLQLPLHMAALAMGQTTNKKMPMQQKLVHTGQGGQEANGGVGDNPMQLPAVHMMSNNAEQQLYTQGSGVGAKVASFNCERKCAAILNLLRQNVVQLSVCSQHISQRDYKRQQQVGLVKLERGLGGEVQGEQAHALDFNGFERQKQISVCAIGVCVCVHECAYVCACFCVCMCVVCGIERDKEQSSRATQVQARVQPRSGKPEFKSPQNSE